MMNAVIAIVFGLIALAFTPHPVVAQEGCKAAQSSCSQLNATCESNCQKVSNNPGACIARACSVPFNTCKANGVWKSPGSPGCWKTNNRT
jgi:hypothetical protein